MRILIRHKILILSASLIIIPVLVIISSLFLAKNDLREKQVAELNKQIKEYTAQISTDIYHLCETSHDLITQKVNSDLNVAHDIFYSSGGFQPNQEVVSWTAINQYSKSESIVNLNKFYVGDEWLGQNSSFNNRTPIVDKIKDIVGGTCTIFQRMNETGDMLRIATNVEKLDGNRAIGTYIPAVNPDGTPNPVISTILKGETFVGRAYVVNAWYLTAYEPIYDENESIVGVLYVGVKQESVESIRHSIMSTVVGKTGYVYVLGGKNSHKGHYIISKGGERDGESIWDAKDADGRYFIQDVVNHGVELTEDDVYFTYYPWLNTGEKIPRTKIAAIKYFEPWDWVIGASTYMDDYYENIQTMENSINSLVLFIVFASLIILGLGFAAAYFFSRKISKPIVNMSEISNKLAKGDIQQEINYKNSDEIGELADAFRNMIAELKLKANIAEHISNGDLSDVFEPDDMDLLGVSMRKMQSRIRRLVNAAKEIAQHGVDGDLEYRATLEDMQGDFAQVLNEFNNTLDAVALPINESANVLQKVAEKQLNVRMKGEYRGDFEKIKKSLNQALENLDTGLQQVATGADQVSSASDQISQGGQGLAQGASEQASSLEEISSSLNEVSSMSNQNYNNTIEGKNLADKAIKSAEKSSESMDKLTEAIDKIKYSTDETQKIMKTIDEIAFQTNLLALNAAVEASRAGEAGKGFAVVAEEVRNLAIRSSEAAKNTADMIEESVNSAEQGVELNAEVKDNLTVINEQIEKLFEIMNQVAAGSEQQKDGVEQVNQALEQLNNVTQQNAATAEESASSAEELNSQAATMKAMTAEFKLS